MGTIVAVGFVFGAALGFLAGLFLAIPAFIGDMGLHGLVHAWPWLEEHARLIPAATFGLAAVWQLTPLKDACLNQCRHPAAFLQRYYARGPRAGLLLGLSHAFFCLGCC